MTEGGGIMAREQYASGDWTVKPGSEGEFVARWRDWIGKTTSGLAGFGSARLLRSTDDPRHFVSFSDWDDSSTRDAWKTSPDFAGGFSACRELCESFRGGDFEEVVQF
jgi:heme-degrading monooxygenase HmoA